MTATPHAPTRIETFCTSGTSPTAPYSLTGHRGPVVLLLGGISATAEPGWWSDLLGAKRPLDTARFRVLSVAYDGVDTRTQALRLLSLLDELGIEHLSAAVGCSYGGMVCLQLAALAPERVGSLVVVGAAHRAHGLTLGWHHIQQGILALATRLGRPEDGVALARALAMTTYRSDRELDERFDRDSLASWLDHHGAVYAQTVPNARYAALSQAIASHAVDPASLRVPLTLIGFDSDLLAPPWLLAELAQAAPDCRAHHTLPSVHGHDAFLLETDALAAPLYDALRAVGVSA